jgi:aspartokinase
MRTIAASIRSILERSPAMAEALSDGIINYSGLARKLKPQLEKEHLKTFTEGAIVMALKRIGNVNPLSRSQVHIAKTVRNITVRSNLVEYAFQNSRSLLKVQEKLLALAEKEEDSFVNFAPGIFETAIIISAPLEKTLQELTKQESCIKQFHTLSSISIRFHPDTALIPGIYYPFFQALAWHGINFIEIVSGFSELTFVFEDKEVDKAFSVIKGLTEVR